MLQETQIGPSEFQINSFKTGFSPCVSYVILTLALHTLVARVGVFCLFLVHLMTVTSRGEVG